jgi:hypothetical protein
MPKNLNHPDKKIGFFDIDSRELSRDGCGLEFRERVLPIADKLNLLYDFAYEHQLVIVFTTCCSGNFLKEDSLDYVRYIPLDAKDNSWINGIEDYRYFYIQKKQYGKPRINCEFSAYNFFKYNSNAIKLFKKLGIKKWVIFGNGFDSCVNLACLRLLEKKFKLIVLEDAVAPAYGSGKTGTEENKKNILKELRDKGAETTTLKKFLENYSTQNAN